jgi:hypothetical protein
MEGGTLELVRFSAVHYNAFVRLYNKSFRTPISLESVRRKYDTEYSGVSHVGFAALQESRMVAYYGVIPTWVVINGNRILACQSADTMTDPEFKGMGLFPKLAELTYSLAMDIGIRFVFGWPNKYSYPVFKNKLGWNEIAKMLDYSKSIKTFPLSKLAFKLRIRKLYNFIFKILLNNGDLLINEFENNSTTVEYIHYKMRNGAFVYRHGNAFCMLSVDYRLKIGAINYQNRDDLDKLLKSLSLICGLIGIQEIVYSTNSFDNHERDALRASGFIASEGLPLMYRSFDGINSDVKLIKLTTLDYDTF